MTARIINADVFEALPTLAPGSVDCVITSPPYYQLRDYGTGTWEGGDPACAHGGGRTAKSSTLQGGNQQREIETIYRDVCGKCGARRVDKQLGLEATVGEYIARLVEVFRLVRTVLAPWGVAFVNIGDTYSGGASGESNLDAWAGTSRRKEEAGYKHRRRSTSGLPPGNLCLVPQRLAIALQDDGWIVRSVICWTKPSAMPQSLSGWSWRRCRVRVKGQAVHTPGTTHGALGVDGNGRQNRVDERLLATWADCPGCPKCESHGGYVLRRGSWRPTSSWEPILMLAKQGGYYADGEGVKTPVAASSLARVVQNDGNPIWNTDRRRDHPAAAQTLDIRQMVDPSGANARDVLRIAAEPLSERHYAAFPTALASWCLRAGTSARGHCPVCGMPHARVLDVKGGTTGRGWNDHEADLEHGRRFEGSNGTSTASARAWESGEYQRTTLGWRPTCSHGDLAPRAPLVLDPFCGSGRVGVACARLGCDFVGIDLSAAYVALAERLCRGEAPLFADLEE